MDASQANAPLPGIESPLSTIFSFVPLHDIVSIVFFLFFVMWVLYTVIAAYHLLRYGHNSSVTIPALVTHILVSGFLALFAISGLH